jgi:hypothetical protein
VRVRVRVCVRARACVCVCVCVCVLGSPTLSAQQFSPAESQRDSPATVAT